jgi:threonyl-tRNA synthetase
VPISSDKHLEYGRAVKARLEAAGLRVELDERNDAMKAKIRDFAMQKVPFVLILGDKEMASDSVSVRTRGKGDEGGASVEQFIGRCKELLQSKAVGL